jgi:lactate permease
MTILDTLLAALPIVLVALLLALRMRPTPAVLIAIAVTVPLSIARFPIDGAVAGGILGSLVPISIAVVVIIFGGVLLAEYLETVGGQDSIGEWLRAASHSQDRAVVLIGLGITPFAESIIGWGLGLITAAPLLLRIGLTRTRAASVALLGLVLCPWGSLGPGNMLMAQLGGIDYRALSIWSAWFSLPVLLVMGAAVLLVGLGTKRALRMAPETLAMLTAMWLVLVGMNVFVSPPLSGILASLAGILTVLGFARLRGGRLLAPDAATMRSLYPYGLLVVAMLAATGLDAVLPLGAVGEVLTNPAIWLLVAAFSVPLFFRTPRAVSRLVIGRASRRFWPVALTTILFIGFGGLLAVNGMSGQLADAAASLGAGFLLLTPAIGFIGGYVTASSSASAAMFTSGVTHAALGLGANPVVALAAQNVATAAAVMTSPSRVSLAISLVTDAGGDRHPEPVDPRRILLHVLGANAVVLLILAPLSLLFASVV